jgi:hypothetical protein
MKTKTYMAVMVLFRMLTDEEQTMRKRMKETKQTLYPSGYHLYLTYFFLKKWGETGRGVERSNQKRNSEEKGLELKWITFKHDSRAKSIKRVNIRLSSFSRTPRGCSDST